MVNYGNAPELFEKKAQILKALGHPVRLCIVRELALQGESNVMNMQNCLDKVPQSTISQHLSILKTAGIIKGQRKGVEVIYSLEDETVKELIKIMFT